MSVCYLAPNQIARFASGFSLLASPKG